MKKKDQDQGGLPKDGDLWKSFRKSVKPLHKEEVVLKKTQKSPPAIRIDERLPRGAPTGLKSSKKPLVSADIEADLNHRDLLKFKAGKYDIEATLDLHGLTLDRAYEKCRTFIYEAFRRKHRKILVITGKGNIGKGLLRESLPQWLNTPDLRPFVLAFLQAKHFHGGEGAYYVLLKRNKGKG